jgi:ubiquinone biosynthesis protein
MSATIEDSAPLQVEAPHQDGRKPKTPIAAISRRFARWRYSPPNNTGLILLLLRILINALALVLAIIITPGIEFAPPRVPINLTPALIILGILFGIVNTLVRPLLLLLTGRLVIRTMGLFLFANQLILFFVVDYLMHPFIVQSPIILWFSLASLVMSLLVIFLEALLGLDIPMVANDTEGRFYWRWLAAIPSGRRNRITESLRLGQILAILSRYMKDLAIERTPLARIRLYMEDLLYGDGDTISGLSTPVKLRLMLQALGPTFVKFGQIVSSRPELVPPEWRGELERLQSDVPPFSYPTARRIVQDELHTPIDRLYASFEEEPFAAASTAQVHRATLPDGTEVVVKIQRPDIDVTVKADLNVIRDLSKTIQEQQEWARNIDFKGLISEFAKNVMLELDYTNEASNARTLAYNMRDIPGVHVPTIYVDRSAQKVLTMEYVSGVKITKVQQLDAAGVDRPRVARTFLRAMIKQILVDRFFHGDPHPGNVLINLQTSEIIFLDMGMMGQLSREKRLALGELIWALKEKDQVGLVRTFRKLSTPFRRVDEARYKDEMERYLERFFTGQDVMSSLSGVISGALNILSQSGLRLDKELTLALKAMIQAEEIFSTLDPNASGQVVDISMDTISEYMRQQLNAEAITETVRTELTRSARELVGQLPSLGEATTKWIQQYQKGRLSVHIDTSDIDEQLKATGSAINSAVSRLVVGLVLAGIIVGSAIAATVRITFLGIELSTLALIFFVVGAMIGGYMVLRDLARSGRSSEDSDEY